jgi:hypothetical protein
MVSYSMAKLARFAVIAVIVLVPAPCVGSCMLRDQILARGFATISNGMSQDAVIKALEPPRDTRDCGPGEFSPWGLPGCVETYIYASAWAPLNPEYPAVWFNRDKQVIGKSVFASP